MHVGIKYEVLSRDQRFRTDLGLHYSGCNAPTVSSLGDRSPANLVLMPI